MGQATAASGSHSSAAAGTGGADSPAANAEAAAAAAASGCSAGQHEVFVFRMAHGAQELLELIAAIRDNYQKALM